MILDPLCVLVLDLDDTLYPEVAYKRSGFEAVSKVCKDLFRWHPGEYLRQLDDAGEKDPIGCLCYKLGMPESVKDSFLWIYRNHFPAISLGVETNESLQALERVQSGIAILTDGRSVTQRMKLKALGLERFPAFISEDYGESKPGMERFERIERYFGTTSYCYVGDNPRKDFLAPKRLGWRTVGMISGSAGIHSQSTVGLSDEYLPDFWIESLAELNGSRT